MSKEGKESYVSLWRGMYTGVNGCKKVTANYAEPALVCDASKA